jgi:hypothetical protein
MKWTFEKLQKEDLENYSRLKDEYFLSKGIQILHVKEEDWIANKQSCIDMCLKFITSEFEKAA